MFKKETEYALRALVYIWQQNMIGHRPGITETAKEIIAPSPFIAKILQRLVNNGLLFSQKGKGGGFYFDEDQSDLLLADVIMLTEGKKVFTSCGFGLGTCQDENSCPIHDQYKSIRTSLYNVFSENTIQDLAEKNLNKFP